jgi:hypothetical protein
MAKHSKFETERRAAEAARLKEIETAWVGSVPKPVAEAFATAVAAARARPPAPPPPDMAPGTKPNPPRFEPRPTKEERNQRPRR